MSMYGQTATYPECLIAVCVCGPHKDDVFLILVSFSPGMRLKVPRQSRAQLLNEATCVWCSKTSQ